MKAPDKRPTRDPKIAKIVEAMGSFDITSSPAWADLDALSTQTYFDGLEIDPDGVILRGKHFKGPISIYVVLHYGGKKDDGFETSDAFAGEFEGHINESGNPIIENVTIDTSPFYEGEPEAKRKAT